jgi:Cu(I)/Ag(I) efflux system membrane fusion protein
MKRSWAREALFVALLACGIATVGCSRRGAETASDAPARSVGAYQIAATTDPDPPAVGENRLTLVIRDAGGKAVTGATVEMVAYMPAMGAMPYMESRGEIREEKPGRYTASYGLSMAGDWEVTLRVRPAGGAPVEAAYRVSTNTKGVSFVSGTKAPGAAGAANAADTSAAADTAVAAVTIDAARRQSLGIRVEPVSRRTLTLPIRAAGRVAYDETRVTEVSLAYSGWVREVTADFTGEPVSQGQTLFRAYSPDLLSGQNEYLEARNALRADTSRTDVAELLAASRRRLELWGVAAEDLRALERTGRASETLPVRSPASGVVLEKAVVRGSPFNAGQVLYRIARTNPVWVLASVFPADLPYVRTGLAARVHDPEAPGGVRSGRVSFVAPDVQDQSRTGTARIEVANPKGALKPGQFVDVELDVPLGEHVAVPQSAVLPTGTRRLVFVDLGDGRLAPREVVLGPRAGDWYAVTSGLAAGERVVTSGNFLVASESRLRSATGKWQSK